MIRRPRAYPCLVAPFRAQSVLNRVFVSALFSVKVAVTLGSSYLDTVEVTDSSSVGPTIYVAITQHLARLPFTYAVRYLAVWSPNGSSHRWPFEKRLKGDGLSRNRFEIQFARPAPRAQRANESSTNGEA